MRLPLPSLPPGQPDPIWLQRLLIVQRICLGVVALISVTVLSVWLFPQAGESLHLAITPLSLPMALTAFFCALEPGDVRSSQPATDAPFQSLYWFGCSTLRRGDTVGDSRSSIRHIESATVKHLGTGTSGLRFGRSIPTLGRRLPFPLHGHHPCARRHGPCQSRL